MVVHHRDIETTIGTLAVDPIILYFDLSSDARETRQPSHGQRTHT